MNSKMHAVAVTLAAVLMGTAGLAACGGENQATRTATPTAVAEAPGEGFNGTVVDPPLRPAHVVLQDTHGSQVDLSRPAPEKVTALFFGYSKCGDVCPTTMADLASARRSLPPALAEKVTVFFVTVDPRRDTAPVLERWLGRFDPDFIGLRGPTELVHQAEQSLYAPESSDEAPPTDPHAGGHHESSKEGADYEVSHSGSVYVFGPGDKSLLYTGGTNPQEYAKDFTRLLTT